MLSYFNCFKIRGVLHFNLTTDDILQLLLNQVALETQLSENLWLASSNKITNAPQHILDLMKPDSRPISKAFVRTELGMHVKDTTAPGTQ